jgi:uncharacterized glyoxalase superfamily protein PhnB
MKLDALGITCKNLNESIVFYRLLGLLFGEPDGDHIEFQIPGGMRIMLDSEELVRKVNPNWIKPVGQRIGLAFLCDSAGEVDTVFNKLISAGYKAGKEPWDAFWGQRYASVLDPDGNSVDLFAPLQA